MSVESRIEESELRYARVQACRKAATALAEDERIRHVLATGLTLYFETEWIQSLPEYGEPVYIGRFKATLHPSDEFVKVEWCEWEDKPCFPRFYRIYGEHFCFGERAKYLLSLLHTHEYLALAYAILDSLSHINERHRMQILSHYRKVSDGPPGSLL